MTHPPPCSALATAQPRPRWLVSRFPRAANPPFAVGDVLCEHFHSPEGPLISQRHLDEKWVIHLGHADVYLPEFCALIHRVRADLHRFPFSAFCEMAFPRLLAPDVAKRYGLCDAWPDILLAVRPYNRSSPARAIGAQSEPYLLDPVQCANLYACLQGEQLRESGLPICVRETLGGWSYRNESKARIAPIRHTTQFLRDEYVYLGAPTQIRSIRALLIDNLCCYLDDAHLPFRVVVGSGCFEMPDAELSATLHDVEHIEDIPILDVEVRLPEDDGWLEVCGASLWGDRLLTRFDIRGLGIDVHSGCCGIGISRLCLALLAYARFQ